MRAVVHGPEGPDRSRRRRSALLLLELLEQHLAGLTGFGLAGSELELANRRARRRTDRAVGGAAIEAEIAQENLDGLGLALCRRARGRRRPCRWSSAARAFPPPGPPGRFCSPRSVTAPTIPRAPACRRGRLGLRRGRGGGFSPRLASRRLGRCRFDIAERRARFAGPAGGPPFLSTRR